MKYHFYNLLIVNYPKVEEMAAAMARAMVASGATGVDILKAMQEALSATGASKEEIAQTLLSAMASSRAAPDVIAKAMFMALHDSGFYSAYLITKIRK